MVDKKYWVGFNLIKGIGAVRMQGLVAYFGDQQTAWGADHASLAETGLGAKVIERVLAACQKVNPDQVWAKIESQGIKILTWQDEAYSTRLKGIDQPPPVMYIRGEYLPDDLFAVVIVGTRRVIRTADRSLKNFRLSLRRMGSRFSAASRAAWMRSRIKPP
jgi:DNA processing protein